MPAYTIFLVKIAPVLNRILGDTGIREHVNYLKVYPPGTMAEQKPFKEQLENGVKMPVTTIILTSIAMYFCQN